MLFCVRMHASASQPTSVFSTALRVVLARSALLALAQTSVTLRGLKALTTAMLRQIDTRKREETHSGALQASKQIHTGRSKSGKPYAWSTSLSCHGPALRICSCQSLCPGIPRKVAHAVNVLHRQSDEESTRNISQERIFAV